VTTRWSSAMNNIALARPTRPNGSVNFETPAADLSRLADAHWHLPGVLVVATALGTFSYSVAAIEAMRGKVIR
jgi:dethiobiotin synthetase